MTYDGDWLGGMPPSVELEGDLELAARRGVEVVIDVRSQHAQTVQPIADAVKAAGLEFVPITGVMEPKPTAAEPQPESPLSPRVVDDVLRVLNAPGRRHSLLLDENGTRSSMIYAIHLAVDEGIAEAEALRAARATGLSQDCAEFVREEVDRRSGSRR